MNKTTRLVTAGVLILVGIFGDSVLEFATNINKPVDEVENVVYEPTNKEKALVADLVSIKFEDKDSDTMHGYFMELADVLETEPGFVKSTGQFREYNIMAGQMHFTGLELKDKYPNVGEKVDEAIMAAIGKENAALSSEKRSDLVNILRAIAWSFKQ